MKDNWKIGLAVLFALLLGFGLYYEQQESKVRQAIEDQTAREWLEEQHKRALAEGNARIENKKKPFMEMSAESRNRKCWNHPDECLLIGMRRDDVIEMLGWPDKKNKTTFSVLGKVHDNEQWVYELGDYEACYVYFEDWQVSGWQR